MQAGAVDLDCIEHLAQFSGIESNALAIDRVRRLKSAFEKLTPNQRLVIELAYYEGMSQTEMAERLKQPLSTVKDLDPERAEDSARRAESGARGSARPLSPTSTDLAPRF